jgi:hypothetical protein
MNSNYGMSNIIGVGNVSNASKNEGGSMNNSQNNFNFNSNVNVNSDYRNNNNQNSSVRSKSRERDIGAEADGKNYSRGVLPQI